MDANVIIRVVQTLLLMILSLTVHEYAHALVATRLGDSTPKDEGRLTLAPHVHIDPIGTLLIPAFGAMTGFPYLGWAKPVRFNPARLRRDVSMWSGAALISIAGPLANLLFAILVALIMRILQEVTIPESVREPVQSVLPHLLMLNIFLFLFNLLPLPPLDGGYLIPRKYEAVREFLARYSFIIFLVMMFTGLFGKLLGPPTVFIFTLIYGGIGLSPAWAESLGG